MRKSAYRTFFELLAFATCLWAQGNRNTPQLPRVTLDTFSDGIREQIQQAYDHAISHPDDAKASGAVGMVLQSYGLFQEATKHYERAAALEPSEFRWTYYLGFVEADRGRCEEAAPTLRRALRIDSDYVPAKLH